MTIKEIAKLAGVSISTVSKIVNGKDQNINSATRERVLKIVKDYNYVPYSVIKSTLQAKTFLIGVLINNMNNEYGFIRGILEYSKENGYNVLICDSHDDEDDELKNITSLCKNNVDGVIWDKVSINSGRHANQFKSHNISIYVVNDEEAEKVVGMDFEKIGYLATQKLIEYKHTKIAFITDVYKLHKNKFLSGFKKSLYDNQIVFNEEMKIESLNDYEFDELIFHGFTSAVCDGIENGLILYEKLANRNYIIPEDFSIIVLYDDSYKEIMYPKISYVKIPYYEFGNYVCKNLIDILERCDEKSEGFLKEYKLENRGSIELPVTSRIKKIVVVGSINMDNIINTGEMPQVGKTVMVNDYFMMPGGKGANQAIGVAKLGHEVALIGKIGKDYEGQMVSDVMYKNHVSMKGVSVDQKYGTGRAYIYVQGDGESSISIYPGANQNLSCIDVERNKQLFENAGFCLLQTEIPMETVESAANIAKQYRVKIILKPSTSHKISAELVRKIDYFVPNRKEMVLLCPECETLEEQADYFLKKGVGTVIITLGHEGCYVKNKEISEYFPAADFVPVDTTGAADAFIAALAVHLLARGDLREAIEYATCAAGFSITRQGVTSALIDKSSLESYVHKSRKI